MPDKIWESYDFKLYPHDYYTNITISFTPKSGVDVWKSYRLMLAIGARLSKLVEVSTPNVKIYSVPSQGPGYICYMELVTGLPLAKMDHKGAVEEALHSMYLFMENPQKYA